MGRERKMDVICRTIIGYTDEEDGEEEQKEQNKYGRTCF